MNEEPDVVVVHRSPTQRKGFAQIPHAVLTDPALSDGTVRLYGILLSYAFQGESFKCGQVKMASDLGKDDRTIRRLLKELHDRGLVTPVRQGQRMVNIYILEDAYALYDSERPQPKKRVRSTTLNASFQEGQDKNVRSESDRTKESVHRGQKSPVMQDKNVLLLKTQEKKLEKKGNSTSSLFQDADILDGLTPAEFAMLEAEARAKVIAETADPVRQLAKDGKAWTSVKPMMRKILSEKTSGEKISSEKALGERGRP